MHYFKKNEPFKQLVHASWEQNIYHKEDLYTIAGFVEAELRQEAMELIQDMNEKMLVANRLTQKSVFFSMIAFGGEGRPPRDLWWVDNVYKYLELSFIPKPSLLAEFGEPPKVETAQWQLWKNDLWEAFDRLDDLLYYSLGIFVTKSFIFKPSTGLVDKIVPYYNSPTAYTTINLPLRETPTLIAIREFHVAILKVYYALLGMAHSMLYKVKNASPLVRLPAKPKASPAKPVD